MKKILGIVLLVMLGLVFAVVLTLAFCLRIGSLFWSILLVCGIFLTAIIIAAVIVFAVDLLTY